VSKQIKKTNKQLEGLVKTQRSELAEESKKVSQEMLRAAEDKLFSDCLEIVETSLDFAELGFDENGQVDESSIPDEWKRMTTREKEKRLRLAKANWMPSAEVPHGIKMAHATMMGIIKARAQQESGTKVLHIENASFPTPSPLTQYEVLEVDD
jgi:hypothetical protein